MTNADLVADGQVLITGPGAEFHCVTRQLADMLGLHVAIEGQLRATGTSFTDAAVVYRNTMAGRDAGFTGPQDLAQWATAAGADSPMLLWLA
ncbi:hypothetical protein [Streptomyces sp. NPDC005953]|uniref:hypothetical protein n=1 Tax=Streptomyces sp. NPDC005953 TaxID=3156719 RepID=UPI0033D89BEA